ncbi:MAG: hypothetical protein KIS92_00055 [Planctomycetota bacterium]|nr:hypothetical protein [Planctomycetota bacterium]
MSYPDDLPATYDSNEVHREAVVDAVQVWRLGNAYAKSCPGDLVGVPPDERDRGSFNTADFLRGDKIQPAVQFTCVRYMGFYEDALANALTKGAFEVKIKALTVLMHVRAPRSVPEQWAAIQSLRNDREHGENGLVKSLCADLDAAFSKEKIAAALQEEPPPESMPKKVDSTVEEMDAFERKRNAYQWYLRAAGVTQQTGLLSRLAQIAASQDLYLSLAAERSLEDFEGPEAEQALAKCIKGWCYNTYIHAASALLKRNKPLLVKTLKEGAVPQKALYQQGLFLARCDDSDAVPILCEALPRYQIIDGEMFSQVERLARPAHAEALEKMAASVREEQKARAKVVLESCRQRWKNE